MKRLITLIRRRALAYELLDEHDREEWDWLTRDPATAWEALARFSALHNSRPRGAASEWRKAVMDKIAHWPE